MLTQKNNTQSQIKLWIPALVWAAVIFSFSSITTIKVNDFFVWDFFAKKLAHVSEYAILYLLIYRATKGKFLLSFILTVAYSATDEFHQSFVPGRSASPIDLGFDISGANIASYVLWKLKQLRQSKQKK